MAHNWGTGGVLQMQKFKGEQNQRGFLGPISRYGIENIDTAVFLSIFQPVCVKLMFASIKTQSRVLIFCAQQPLNKVAMCGKSIKHITSQPFLHSSLVKTKRAANMVLLRGAHIQSNKTTSFV